MRPGAMLVHIAARDRSRADPSYQCQPNAVEETGISAGELDPEAEAQHDAPVVSLESLMPAPDDGPQPLSGCGFGGQAAVAARLDTVPTAAYGRRNL